MSGYIEHMFNVAIKRSITVGLHYEVNASAALKIDYQVANVEDDQAELAEANKQTTTVYLTLISQNIRQLIK